MRTLDVSSALLSQMTIVECVGGCGCCSSAMTGPGDHHDVEIVDEQGRRLARRRLPEGLDGVTRLHALIAQFVPDEWGALDPVDAASRVKVGIETDRGQWVQALVAAGYEVFAINPVVGGALPGAALDLGCEVGCRRCACAGRDRAPGPVASSPGRRGLRAERGDQAGGP
jgi:hypothetical protein